MLPILMVCHRLTTWIRPVHWLEKLLDPHLCFHITSSVTIWWKSTLFALENGTLTSPSFHACRLLSFKEQQLQISFCCFVFHIKCDIKWHVKRVKKMAMNKWKILKEGLFKVNVLLASRWSWIYLTLQMTVYLALYFHFTNQDMTFCPF